MQQSALSIEPLVSLGPVEVTTTVVTTWALMAVAAAAAWFVTRAANGRPGVAQVAAEGVMQAIEEAINAVVPEHTPQLLPVIATLWIFLALANLSGLIPGVHAPTRDLSATTALALVVFFSAHWFGIRAHGLKAYLRHYLSPSPLMLPFHIISEITRTVALAVRLFGNMMSLELAALLVLMVAGFLAPVPILMLHVIEALVQAYIFGMLALIYIAGGLQSQKLKQQKGES